MATATANLDMPRRQTWTQGKSDRELIELILKRSDESENAFDQFTVETTGVRYNGEKLVYDKSGGLLGRMEMRVLFLEKGFKVQMKTIIAMLILIVVNGGITNIDKIVQFIEKLKFLFP